MPLNILLALEVTIGFIVFWHCVAWAKGRSLPRMLYLWTLMVIFLGELAIFNHSKCHARTHNLEVLPLTRGDLWARKGPPCSSSSGRPRTLPLPCPTVPIPRLGGDQGIYTSKPSSLVDKGPQTCPSSKIDLHIPRGTTYVERCAYDVDPGLRLC